MTALVEGVHPETDHLLAARHQGQAPEIDGRVLINDGVAPAASLIEIEISDAYADDLVGHVVGPQDVPGVEIALGALPTDAATVAATS